MGSKTATWFLLVGFHVKTFLKVKLRRNWNYESPSPSTMLANQDCLDAVRRTTWSYSDSSRRNELYLGNDDPTYCCAKDEKLAVEFLSVVITSCFIPYQSSTFWDTKILNPLKHRPRKKKKSVEKLRLERAKKRQNINLDLNIQVGAEDGCVIKTVT